MLNRIAFAEVSDWFDGVLEKLVKHSPTYMASDKLQVVSTLERLKRELPEETSKREMQQMMRDRLGDQKLQL